MRTAKMSTIGVPRFINTVRQERVNLGGEGGDKKKFERRAEKTYA